MIFAEILLVVLTVMIGVVCVSVILSNRQVSESDTESQVKEITCSGCLESIQH